MSEDEPDLAELEKERAALQRKLLLLQRRHDRLLAAQQRERSWDAIAGRLGITRHEAKEAARIGILKARRNLGTL